MNEGLNPPLISVVVAVFNRADTLGECLESVVKQSFKDFELIVIDGASTDGTIGVIKQFEGSISFWSSAPDSGIYDAWNKGIAKARGEWICFLGSDDFIRDPDVLSKLSLVLEEQPGHVDFVYSKIMLITKEGKDLFVQGRPWKEVCGELRGRMPVPHPLMMHRRRLFDTGGFDVSYRISGDYEFFLRHAGKDNVAFAEQVLAISMRPGGVSSELSNARRSMLEVRQAQKRNSIRGIHPRWLFDFAAVEIRSLAFKTLGEIRAKRLVDRVRALRGSPAYWTKI